VLGAYLEIRGSRTVVSKRLSRAGNHSSAQGKGGLPHSPQPYPAIPTPVVLLAQRLVTKQLSLTYQTTLACLGT
jgi:hypothetical protein